MFRSLLLACNERWYTTRRSQLMTDLELQREPAVSWYLDSRRSPKLPYSLTTFDYFSR